MSTTLLLFDDLRCHLGEVILRKGTFVSVTLTQYGESILGDQLKEWQTIGILRFREIEQERGADVERQVFQERISIHSEDFWDACRHWLFQQGYHVIPAGESILPLWEKLLMLPLEGKERFSMLNAICQASSEELAGWSKAIEEAYTSIQKVSQPAS